MSLHFLRIALATLCLSLTTLALAQDLDRVLASEAKVYLDRFWNREDSRVELSHVSEATEADIVVNWPRYMRRQQRNYSILITKFAASAYPDLRITKFKQLGMPGFPAAENSQDRLEKLWSVELQTRGQKKLDALLGKSKALVLVNVTFQRGRLFILDPPVADDKRIARIEACVFSRQELPKSGLEVLRNELNLDKRRDELRTINLKTIP